MHLTPLLRLLLVGLTLVTFAACQGQTNLLPPEEVARRVQAGKAVLIDVREATEWEATGVAAPAHLLALSDLRGDRKKWKDFLAAHRDKELLLYCRSGNRSGQAAKLLQAEGYQTANVGAFTSWQKAGLPTRKPNEPRP